MDSNKKVFIIVLCIVSLFNCLFIGGGTVLFDKKQYYGESGKILFYDDLFFDFSQMNGLEYHYDNYSNSMDVDFDDVENLLKKSSYKVLPKFFGRSIVLFQTKGSSCGKIEVIRLPDLYGNLSKDINFFDSHVVESKIYYARIFKVMGRYYLYYYPKTEPLFSGFSVCEILSDSDLEANNIFDAYANNYTYPSIYPSYMQYVLYNPLVKIIIIVLYIFEVGIVYYLIKKFRLTSRQCCVLGSR